MTTKHLNLRLVPLLFCGLLIACGDDSESSESNGSTSVATATNGGTGDASTTMAGMTTGTTGDASTGGESTTGDSSTGGESTSGGTSTTGDASTTGEVSTTGDTSTTGDENIEVNFFYGHFMLDNYLEEVEGHTNVVLGPSSVEFLQEAKSRGIKPIVWISMQIYPWQPVGDHLELRPDYLEIWNAYAATIAPYADDIYGFFPHDEPFWAAKLSTADQDALNQAIKASFPDKPILTCFAWPTINDDDFVIPSTYDIVSYNNFYGSSFESDVQYYETLKSKLMPGQTMFLIGDGFSYKPPLSDQDQELRAAKAYQAYELARTPGEPLVGILNFIWNGYNSQWPGPGGDYLPGVRDMPLAVDHFIQVGQTALAEQ